MLFGTYLCRLPKINRVYDTDKGYSHFLGEGTLVFFFKRRHGEKVRLSLNFKGDASSGTNGYNGHISMDSFAGNVYSHDFSLDEMGRIHLPDDFVLAKRYRNPARGNPKMGVDRIEVRVPPHGRNYIGAQQNLKTIFTSPEFTGFVKAQLNEIGQENAMNMRYNTYNTPVEKIEVDRKFLGAVCAASLSSGGTVPRSTRTSRECFT